MLLGICAAVAAGACFAVAAVLQQRAAAARPADEMLSWRLIVRLAGRRMWLGGIGLAVLAYAFQALALSLAPLSVVQPTLASELVFAIPVSVRLHHLHLRTRDRVAVLAVAGGLSIAILTAKPRPGDPIAPFASWAPVVGVILTVVVVAVAVARRRAGMARAALLALAAAVLMALESAFMAATTRRFEHGGLDGFVAWEPYAMATCSIVMFLLIQSAFQAGPLAVSMPIADVVSPVGGIGIGLALFGETVSTSPPRLAGAVAGLVTLLIGIVALDRSPVVRRVHREEQGIGLHDESPGSDAG